MNALERVYIAMSNGKPDRIPYIPKIWVDLAARLTNTDLLDVLKSPQLALDILAEAGLMIGVDAVRQFHFPERKIRVEGENVFEINAKGVEIGRIDMLGGLMTYLNNAEDYKLEDPYVMAHYHYWASNKPFIEKIEDVKKICVPDKSYYKELGWGKRQKKVMDYIGNKIALIGDCDSATLAFYEAMRGMENAMYDLILQPELVHAVMDKGTAIAIEKGKFNIDLGVRIVRLNDSIANMNVISPESFREFIKPHMKEFCDELHSYDKNVKIYCHICGNIMPIIEDLVEVGLDCIAPLDPLGGFSVKEIKEKVGDSIALMGGVNTLSFINSTKEEIEREAISCIEGASKSGGYILGSGCVVPRNAQIENIIALKNLVETYWEVPGR